LLCLSSDSQAPAITSSSVLFRISFKFSNFYSVPLSSSGFLIRKYLFCCVWGLPDSYSSLINLSQFIALRVHFHMDNFTCFFINFNCHFHHFSADNGFFNHTLFYHFNYLFILHALDVSIIVDALSNHTRLGLWWFRSRLVLLLRRLYHALNRSTSLLLSSAFYFILKVFNSVFKLSIFYLRPGKQGLQLVQGHD
jgi:hypothetical protein